MRVRPLGEVRSDGLGVGAGGLVGLGAPIRRGRGDGGHEWTWGRWGVGDGGGRRGGADGGRAPGCPGTVGRGGPPLQDLQKWMS